MDSFTSYLIESSLICEKVRRGEIKRLEKKINGYLKDNGYTIGILFTRHFFDRLEQRTDDSQTGESDLVDLSIREIERILQSIVDRYADDIQTLEGRKFLGHFVDMFNGLDIPFAIQPDTSGRYGRAVVLQTIIKRGRERMKQGGFSNGKPVFQI